MALATKITLYLTIIFFFFGQLFRLQIFNISIPVFEIAFLLLAILNLFNQKITLKSLRSPVVYFAIFSLLTLIINWFRYPFSITSFLYWLRLVSMLSFFIFPLKIDQKIDNFFQIILWSNIIFGFIQYFFWPDFTYFSTQNWDPHLYRLLSTFFDPTFTALIYLFFLLKIYFNHPTNRLLLFIPYLGLALTYSRSSLIAFFIVFIYIAIKKYNLKIFLTTLLLVFLTILLLPRMPGEGTKLERTSSIKAKIINYREGAKLFFTSPIIGIGYNNLPSLRSNSNSHANSGFDSSLLTIAITTGLIGLIFFIKIFASSINSNSLYWQSLLLAVFIHSLFANSLLYPWILFFLVFEFRYHK